jgi:hypothetical protein
MVFLYSLYCFLKPTGYSVTYDWKRPCLYINQESVDLIG